MFLEAARRRNVSWLTLHRLVGRRRLKPLFTGFFAAYGGGGRRWDQRRGLLLRGLRALNFEPRAFI